MLDKQDFSINKKWAPNLIGVPILQSAPLNCRFAKQITD